jgi:endonuclease/exonuclease/phosphatase (EEP) superfamily protein YafD
MLFRFSPAPRVLLVGLLAGYLIFLVVAVILASYWPQPPSWIALANEVSPHLFVPAPILLVVSLLLRARVAFAIGVAPIALFAALYGMRFVPAPAASAGPESQEIVVYSANVAERRTGYAPLLTQVARAQVDVFAVQEPSPRTNDLQEGLATLLPYHVLEPQRNGRGVGVWSRFPILDAQTLNLGEERGNLSQRVRLDVGGRVVTLYNVHLNAPFVPDWAYDAGMRRRQVEALLTDVQAQDGPVILAGDFNLTERTYDYRRLAQTLTDGYAAAGWGRGLGLTFPTPEWAKPLGLWLAPYVRIDYVWTGAGVSAREVRVVDGNGSDHLGLVARIALPGGS